MSTQTHIFKNKKILQTVFACSHGAQVQFFDKNICWKSRELNFHKPIFILTLLGWGAVTKLGTHPQPSDRDVTRRNNGKPLPPYIQAAHGKQAGRGPPRNLSGNKEGKYSHLPGEGHWAKIVTVASVASVEQAYSVSTWSTLMYTQVQYTATVDLSLCWDFQCCRSSTGILIKVQFRKTCFTQHVAKFHFHKTIGILKIYIFTHTLFYFKEQSPKIKFGIRFKIYLLDPKNGLNWF